MSLVFCILHQNGSSEPILRVSSDAEQPYGPMLRLATSGTISSGIIAEEATTAAEGEEATTAAEGEGETVEEEAAGGEEEAAGGEEVAE